MKIKILFALILDHQGHNFARKLAYEIHCHYNTGMVAARLPQHVSLGPGFEIDHMELDKAEAYFETLARTTRELTLQFTQIGLRIVPNESGGLGVIWMDVEENPGLRALHARIYTDVKEFGWPVNWALGEKYQFHSTIAYDGQPGAKYQEIYDTIPEKKLQLVSRIRRIGMFCPPDETNTPGTFFTYQILPLGADG